MWGVVVEKNVEMDVNEGEVFVERECVREVGKDVVRIGFVEDVVREDLVLYYENDGDGVGIEGRIGGIVYEEDVRVKDKVFW